MITSPPRKSSNVQPKAKSTRTSRERYATVDLGQKSKLPLHHAPDVVVNDVKRKRVKNVKARESRSKELELVDIDLKIRTAASMLPFIFLVEITQGRPLRIPNMGQRLCKRPSRDPPPPMQYKNLLLRYDHLQIRLVQALHEYLSKILIPTGNDKQSSS